MVDIVRDFIELGLSSVLILLVVMMIMHHDTSAVNQEETVQIMNTAIRTNALSNANHASRIQEGQLFINKEGFENDVRNELENADVNILSEDATFTFHYLEEDSGSIKAVRLFLETYGREYQATAIVDIAE